MSYMRILFVTGLCVLSSYVSAKGLRGFQNSAVIHRSFDILLREYVHVGNVDYRELKKNEALLNEYLYLLNMADPFVMDRNDQLAFWINAYNAFTLKLILNYYPDIESIKDIPSRRRWRASSWGVNSQLYSLDHIEREILGKMGEPRVRFATVRASESCPDLLSEAYLPDKLEEQLEYAAGRFLTDDRKGVKVMEEEGILWGMNHNLYLSSIFDRFEDDFTEASGSVVDFILPYVDEETRDFIDRHREELNIKYLDHDWRLNGR